MWTLSHLLFNKSGEEGGGGGGGIGETKVVRCKITVSEVEVTRSIFEEC